MDTDTDTDTNGNGDADADAGASADWTSGATGAAGASTGPARATPGRTWTRFPPRLIVPLDRCVVDPVAEAGSLLVYAGGATRRRIVAAPKRVADAIRARFR